MNITLALTYTLVPVVVSGSLAGWSQALAAPINTRPATNSVASTAATSTTPLTTGYTIAQRSGVNDQGTINFPPGRTSTQVTGFVGRNQIDRYTFTASAGQPTSINIGSATGQVFLTLVSPGGIPLQRAQAGGAGWSGTLPENGTYTLDVVNAGGGSRYTINLSIRPGGGGAQVRNRGAIRFAPGNTYTQVNGYLPPQNTDRYTFTAAAGQPTNLSIGSPTGEVLLTLIDPNGNPIVRYQGGATFWRGSLPASGTYTVDVVNVGRGSEYTLSLGIAPG